MTAKRGGQVRLRSMDKRLVTILLIVFVQMVGAGMILPILPIYAQNEFGMSPTAIALLVSSFFAAQFIAGPILGRWSDRIGRVPVLVVSQIGTVIAFAAFGLAASAWMLFAARIFDGLTGGNLVVAQAYITDITPANKRAQALGLIGAMFGLGFIVGPAIGGVLVGLGGPRVPYFFAAGAAAIVVLLTVLVLDESHTHEDREQVRTSGTKLTIRNALRNRPLLYLLLITFLVQFSLGIVMATFALFGEAVLFETNVELGIGILLAFIGLSQIVTQVALLPRFLERFGEARLITVGIIIRAAGLGIYAVMVSPWQAAVGGILFAAGGALTRPPTQSLATTTVDDSHRGAVLGIVNSSQSFSIIFSTAIAGVLFSVGAYVPNAVSFGVAVFSLIPAIAISRHFHRGLVSQH
jgi:DHA1 family tetracycline resistance protein-like MFS transporter